MHVLTPKGDGSEDFFREKYDDEPMANNESLAASSTKPIPIKSMESEREIKSRKKRKIRRGYGKKNIRKNKLNEIKLSIVGTNSAGLKGKKESFFSLINMFSPSIITIQETKHKKIETTKLPGYQTF